MSPEHADEVIVAFAGHSTSLFSIYDSPGPSNIATKSPSPIVARGGQSPSRKRPRSGSMSPASRVIPPSELPAQADGDETMTFPTTNAEPANREGDGSVLTAAQRHDALGAAARRYSGSGEADVSPPLMRTEDVFDLRGDYEAIAEHEEDEAMMDDEDDAWMRDRTGDSVVAHQSRIVTRLLEEVRQNNDRESDWEDEDEDDGTDDVNTGDGGYGALDRSMRAEMIDEQPVDDEEDEDDYEEDDDEEWGVPNFPSVDGEFGQVEMILPRRSFIGARNLETVKDCNFLGVRSDKICSGSDDGNFFIWDKSTGKLEGIWEGDGHVVNVMEQHPTLPLIAVSGIDDTVKMFVPTAVRPQPSFVRTQLQDRIIRANTRPQPSPFANFDLSSLVQGTTDERARRVQECTTQHRQVITTRNAPSHPSHRSVKDHTVAMSPTTSKSQSHPDKAEDHLSSYDTASVPDLPIDHPLPEHVLPKNETKGNLPLPPIILGCAPFGWGIYADDSSISSDFPLRIVRLALRSGVTAFDTSPHYHPSEIVLGNALHALASEYPRESYQLITKAGKYGSGMADHDYRPETIRRSVERSLKRLKTAYLDVVYLHDVEFVSSPPVTPAGNALTVLPSLLSSPSAESTGKGDDMILASLGVLRDLQAEGKIRKVGIAGYPLPVLLRLALLVQHRTAQPIDIVQTYGHETLINATLQAGYLDAFTGAAGVAQVVNAAPLLMGLLTTSGGPPWHPARELPMYRATRDAVQLLQKKERSLEDISAGFGFRRLVQKDGKEVPVVIGCKDLGELHMTLKSWNAVNSDGESKDAKKERKEIEGEVRELFEQLGVINTSWQSPPESVLARV
ncbi:hypothetical protein P7C73_g755, partial [Tremellales sp. Uapishka_1]